MKIIRHIKKANFNIKNKVWQLLFSSNSYKLNPYPLNNS